MPYICGNFSDCSFKLIFEHNSDAGLPEGLLRRVAQRGQCLATGIVAANSKAALTTRPDLN